MKIGFVCMPVSGHLNPMIALACEVRSLGHHVHFFTLEDAAAAVRAADLPFHALSQSRHPLGSMEVHLQELAKKCGFQTTEYWFTQLLPDILADSLSDLERLTAELGIEGLAFDTGYRYATLVARKQKLPYAEVYNVLHSDRSGTTPMSIFDLPYDPTPKGRRRNLKALGNVVPVFQRTHAIALHYAEQAGLQVDGKDPGGSEWNRLILSQTPEEFDLPDIPQSANFRYAGPFSDPSARAPIPFAWESLSEAPLIYASLGTLVNGLVWVYKALLESAKAFSDHQFVLSIGKHVDPADLGLIPANMVLVREAPQLELLKRATLCITHAGLNTVLEALRCGVPLVAFPIGFDQPGVALRIEYHGLGEVLRLETLTTDVLTDRVKKVLTNNQYATSARRLEEKIYQHQGLKRAANLLTEALAR
jgi:zeaxanthin glucosyltransferase